GPSVTGESSSGCLRAADDRWTFDGGRAGAGGRPTFDEGRARSARRLAPHEAPSASRTTQARAARIPAPGRVRTHATRMRLATPQRTARAPWLAPTPMI